MVRRDAGRWSGTAIALLAALLALGLVLRIALVPLPGHSGDTSIMARWSADLAAHGSWGFYQRDASVYPALLYVLWPLGVVFHGAQLEVAVKAVSIPFDLGIGIGVAALGSRLASVWAGLGAAALYLLNPGPLAAGPLWGQVDAAGTLVFLAALVAAADRRHGTAGALSMLAGMFKPQFGLVFLPVLVAAALDSRRALVRALLAAIAAYAVLAAPLGLDPLRYAGELGGIAGFLPYASLYAFNPWGLALGFETPDGAWGVVGLALLAVGLVLAVLPLRRRRDLPGLLASGALVIFAFYFLPTRVHERYLFPALAVLAPLAVAALRDPTRGRGLRVGAYVLLSAAFALTIVYTLVAITPFRLTPALDEALLSGAAVWTIGLAMIGSAVAWIALLAREVWGLSSPRA